MKRRVIAAVVAILLAVGGGAMLYNYVRNADARAMAGMESRQVLVVTSAIPAGTPAEAIDGQVELRNLPQSAVVPGALGNATDLAGLSTTVDLAVGEQLLRSRFAEPTLDTSGDVPIGKDKQQLTLRLEPERVVGAEVAAGDTVAVFVTVADRTQLVFDDVLLTRLQGAPSGEDGKETDTPSNDLLVTLAVSPKQAERLVFAAENGRIWLARESTEPSTGSSQIVDAKNIFQ